MFDALVEAHNDFIKTPVGYAFQAISMEVNIDISALPEVLEKKQLQCIPRIARNSTSPTVPDDDLSYVCGLKPDKGKAYREMLEKLYQDTKLEVIARLIKYLEKRSEEILDNAKNSIPQAEINSAVVRFSCIHNEGDFYISDFPEVREWWKSYYLSKMETVEEICQITGEKTDCIVKPVKQKLKRITGIQPSGAALISFDKTPFQSWGKKSNDNAFVSRDILLKGIQSLDYFLHTPQHRINLGKDASENLIYWSQGNTVELKEIDRDYLTKLSNNPYLPNFKNAKTPTRIEEGASLFFKQISAANKVSNISKLEWKAIKSKPFYLLKLQGNGGRIIVSEWQETTVEQIEENISSFFVSQKYHPAVELIPIWQLAKQIKSHNLTAQLWDLTLLKKPLPNYVGIKILAEFKKGKKPSKSLYKLLGVFMGEKQDTESVAATLGKICFLMHIAQCNKQENYDSSQVIKSFSSLIDSIHKTFPVLYGHFIKVYWPKANKAISELHREYNSFLMEKGVVISSIPKFTDKDKFDFCLGFGYGEAHYTKLNEANKIEYQNKKKPTNNTPEEE